MAGALASKISPRQPPEVAVDGLHQDASGSLFSIAPGDEESGHV
jgi:hypothetical protein